jgi:carboxylesterase type B
LFRKLGAFGWLAGSDFQAQGGDPNAGLLDQKFALEWIQKYIHLFGGDPNKVTLMGESAGAGSILNHLAAPNTSSLFHQVIAQSPFQPHLVELDGTFSRFLHALKVKTLEEARKLPSKDLLRANQKVIEGTFYGSYVFGESLFCPPFTVNTMAKVHA